MDRQTRMYDNFDKVEQKTIKEILTIVYDSLDERGYARNVIGRIERDDLVEELIKAYLDK